MNVDLNPACVTPPPCFLPALESSPSIPRKQANASLTLILTPFKSSSFPSPPLPPPPPLHFFTKQLAKSPVASICVTKHGPIPTTPTLKTQGKKVVRKSLSA